jgi:tripartite-type tricarboxylate transporter receptor subunit TctC
MMRFARAVAAALGLLLAAGAGAQSYPGKPIRIINPYAAGGGIDMLARLIAQKMQERWGQPVLVDSKPGAGGNIGAEYVAKSAADGYTLLITAGTVTTNPYFFAKMSFDIQKDLAPISLVASQEFYLVVANNFPVRTMPELIAYAKAHPGKISYSTPGIGTPQHLGAELLKSMAGIDIVHVPYKGQMPAINDVMAGQVQLTWVTLNVALPLIRSGKVRGIAVAASSRPASLKQVPVVAETVPGYQVNTWFAMFAPAGTPPVVVRELTAEIQRIAQLADFREKLEPLGYEVASSTPAELTKLIAADLAKWGKVVKDAGIKPE